MKVKNIMFSGFMAAILSGVACSADAAGFQVASKQYVDAREAAIEAAQAQVDARQDEDIAKKEDVANKVVSADELTDMQSDVKAQKYTSVAVAEAIAASAAGAVGTRVDTLETTVGNEGSGLVKDVNALETTVGTIGDSGLQVNGKTVTDIVAAVVALDEKTNGIATDAGLTALRENVTEVSGKVTSLESTVGGANSGLVKDVDDLQEALTETGTTGSAIKANADAIAAINSQTDGILKQANDYTDVEVKELADGAVATNTAAIAILDGDASVEGSVKKQIKDASDATKTAYEAYALPKPSAECANTTCVLATDGNGQPYWTQLWMYGADGESATESNP